MDSAAFFQMVTKGGAVGSLNTNQPAPLSAGVASTTHANLFSTPSLEYHLHNQAQPNPLTLLPTTKQLTSAPATVSNVRNTPTTLFTPQTAPMFQQTTAPGQQQILALSPQGQPQQTTAYPAQPLQIVYVPNASSAGSPATMGGPAPSFYAVPQPQQQQVAPKTPNFSPPQQQQNSVFIQQQAPPAQNMHVILPVAASSVNGTNANPTSIPLHHGMHDTCGPVLLNGRLRHGRNVHSALAGICRYVSYNDPIPTSSIVVQPQPTAPCVTPLPLFVQMFPSEHKEQFQLLFERILQLVCGPAMATVHAAEPRSDTSFLVFLTTSCVWHVIHFLRCRVLMDRHGFWYAEDFAQFEALMQYCDRVRSLPPPQRNAATDGLPSRALVVELSRTAAAVQGAPPAPAPFDAQLQMRVRE